MCRSVPQIPVFETRIRTSLIPISGSGTSSSQRPSVALALTSARMRASRYSRRSTCAASYGFPEHRREPPPLVKPDLRPKTVQVDHGEEGRMTEQEKATDEAED